jgi:hypothetical protein
MCSMLLMEQFHLNVFTPEGPAPANSKKTHRLLEKARFRAELRAAAQAVFRRYSALRRVHIQVSR